MLPKLSLLYYKTMKQLIIFLFCVLLANQLQAQVSDPILQHDSFQIFSKAINESRQINVWMPAEYKNGNTVLPVLYMPDGGTNEDFPHVANTLEKLIAAKQIPAFILVGIANTERRRDMTGPTAVTKDKTIAPRIGGSENFLNFIVQELKPEINKRYRTQNESGIIGESLAGLFIVETFFSHPESFDFYIAIDPSLWWNDAYLIKHSSEYLSKMNNSPKRLWFAGSSAKDIFKNTRKLRKILTDANLPQLKWKYSDEPKEKHNTIYRATKEKALIWTLNK